MKTLKSILLLSSFVVLVSCGGKEEKKDSSSEIKIGNSQSNTQEKNPNEVLLTGNDMMKFNLSEIKVEAGKEVTLTLKHIGKIDKLVMGHNFVLLKPDTNLQEYANAAAAAGEEKDWIPESDAVITHTKMIGGGEETTITFMAPEAGTYDFICSFPGHLALMKGKFIVE